MCRIPNGTTAEVAACLYNRHNLTCYQCGGGGTGFNLTSISVSVLGLETSSCLVNMWVEGQYVCLAQRLWQNGNTSMFQQIGSFNASKPVPQPSPQPVPEPSSQPVPEPSSQPVPEPSSQPVPEPTSQPAVCIGNSNTSLLVGLIIVGVVAFVEFVILAYSCIRRCCPKKHKCKKVTECWCKLHGVKDTACLLYTSHSCRMIYIICNHHTKETQPHSASCPSVSPVSAPGGGRKNTTSASCNGLYHCGCKGSLCQHQRWWSVRCSNQ